MKLNAITNKGPIKLASPNHEFNHSFENSISSQNEFNTSQTHIVSSSVSATSVYPLSANPLTSLHVTNVNSPTFGGHRGPVSR